MTKNNEPKFTPAPWTVHDKTIMQFRFVSVYSDEFPYCVANLSDSSTGKILCTAKVPQPYDWGVIAANAALIAAAPEMFCLLEEIQRESYDTLDEEGNGILVIPEETFSKIAKALAKARGEKYE